MTKIDKQGAWNKTVLGGFFFEKLINGGGASISDLRVYSFITSDRGGQTDDLGSKILNLFTYFGVQYLVYLNRGS